ncbi:RNA polymerase sigma factor [Acidobacteriota bacterium]
MIVIQSGGLLLQIPTSCCSLTPAIPPLPNWIRGFAGIIKSLRRKPLVYRIQLADPWKIQSFLEDSIITPDSTKSTEGTDSGTSYLPHHKKPVAFNTFYTKISRSFWLYILCISGDEGLSDEIFQESFLRFIRKAPAHLNEHQMKAYLYKTASRLMIDRARQIKKERESLKDFESIDGEDKIQSMSMDMRKVFLLLQPRERKLLWLAFVEEYSHREIAGILSAGEKSIKVMLHRTKTKFAALLEEKGYAKDSLIFKKNETIRSQRTEV